MELQPDRPLVSILVPVDFSASSDQALRVAIDLARSSGAQLVLVHVHEPVLFSARRLRDASPLGVFGLSALEELTSEVDSKPLFDSRLEALQHWLLAKSGLRVAARLRAGSAAAEIIDVAFEEHSDLIVMGTHGRTGLPRWLMGSVAETVVRHARCPVLTLRIPEPAPPITQVDSGPPPRQAEKS
jgi:nucleotide-binding universal stress UspA family protein